MIKKKKTRGKWGKVLGFSFFIKTSNQTFATNNRTLSKIESTVAEISIIGSAANLSPFLSKTSYATDLPIFDISRS